MPQTVEEVLKDVHHRFAYHRPPTPEIGALHSTVREKHKEVAEFLVTNLPPSRELSLALTKLEESMMWANGCIARDHDGVQRILDAKTDARERGII